MRRKIKKARPDGWWGHAACEKAYGDVRLFRPLCMRAASFPTSVLPASGSGVRTLTPFLSLLWAPPAGKRSVDLWAADCKSGREPTPRKGAMRFFEILYL